METPLTAADRVEIVELCARYDQAVDHDDVDAWVATFAEDGSFDSPMGSASGLADLRSWSEGYLPNTHGKRHASLCHVVDGDGETARHTGYLTVYETAERPALVATGEYTDELAKVDGRWRFTHRQLSVDPSFSFEGPGQAGE